MEEFVWIKLNSGSPGRVCGGGVWVCSSPTISRKNTVKFDFFPDFLRKFPSSIAFHQAQYESNKVWGLSVKLSDPAHWPSCDLTLNSDRSSHWNEPGVYGNSFDICLCHHVQKERVKARKKRGREKKKTLYMCQTSLVFWVCFSPLIMLHIHQKTKWWNRSMEMKKEGILLHEATLDMFS